MTGISSGAVLRNTLKLAAGSGFAKLIGLAAMPVLTRMYGPESFGTLSVFLSILVIVTPLYTLRYSVAIPMTKTRSEAGAVSAVCLILILLNFLISIILLNYWGGRIFNALNAPDLSSVWLIIPVSIAVGALLEVVSFHASRNKEFSLMGKNSVLQSASGSISQIILWFTFLGFWGLMAGHFFRLISGLVHMLWGVGLSSLKFRSEKKRIYYVIRKYSDLPKYRLMTQLTFGFAAQAPIFFCARIYGIEMTGQAALAFMAIAIPVTVLGASTSKAYYAEIGRLERKNSDLLMNVTKKVSLRQAMIALPISILAFVLSPYIFPYVFGEEWRVSGRIAAALSISMFFQFIYTSTSDAMVVTGRLFVQMLNQFVRVVLVFISFLLSWHIGLDVVSAFFLYALLLSLSYIWGIFQVFSSILNFNRVL